MARMSRHARRALAAVAAAALLSACDSSIGASDDPGIVYGPATKLGSGTLRTYAVLRDGAPQEIGVAIDSAAMATLPPAGDAMGPGPMFDLPLPAQAGVTPYHLVEVDWNPNGHPPAGVYDKPHFDIHFYYIDATQREAIDPADPQFDEKAAAAPPAAQLPQGYVAIPGAVPFMGVHWVDPSSPELHGQPFTHTFIYGGWDGHVIFVEPMVSRAYLSTRPSFQAAIPQPQQVPQPGLYPGTQRIYWDAATASYRVALADFTARQ